MSTTTRGGKERKLGRSEKLKKAAKARKSKNKLDRLESGEGEGGIVGSISAFNRRTTRATKRGPTFLFFQRPLRIEIKHVLCTFFASLFKTGLVGPVIRARAQKPFLPSLSSL